MVASGNGSVMNLLDPRHRVLRIPGSFVTGIERREQSPFASPIPPRQREAAARLHTSRDGTLPFNGGAVRLDAVKSDSSAGLELAISRVEFFDFLATNCARTLPESWDARPGTYRDVLADTALANIIAVSLIIEDSEGRIGIVKRSAGVHVSSGAYCATVAGTLDHADFEEADPFAHCATREAAEELSLAVPEPQFDGIVISMQKLQPVFLYSAVLDAPWGELAERIAGATDAHLETDALIAVPLDRCVAFIAQHDMTDVAAYQLWMYVTERGVLADNSG